MPRRVAALFLALALAGCEHTAPFPPGDYGSDQPFGPGSPRRITLNLGDDRAPAWLPDESGLLYSFQRLDRPDRDRCLGLLPPDGGQLLRTICDRLPAADDSTDALTEPAADAAGRLAYVVTSSRIDDSRPRATALVLGTLADPTTARALVTFPYLGADGAFREGASHVRWLGDDTLIYLAEHVGYLAPCRGCPLDTLRTGIEIALLDAGAASPVPEAVPGTSQASSVAVGETPDVIYYTLGGDSRVVRRVRSAGTTSMVHDFGAAGIARDVQVTGGRLVAIVGGTVAFAYDSLLGYDVQRDGGGFLYMVDLGTGAETVLSGVGSAFRHPALSPSGKRVVAELVSGGARGGGTADLWEFDLP